MIDQIPFSTLANEFAMNPEPRCACVILVDVSGSMGVIVEGETQDLGYNIQRDGQTYRAVSGGVTRMQLVNEGLKLLQSELQADSLASQRVELAMVTFGSSVTTAIPFTSAMNFQPPELVSEGETPMGGAILKGIELIEERKRLYKENGVKYYRPWIFLLTDGEPTDNWQLASQKVKEGERNKSFVFFSVGVEGANFDKLEKIGSEKRKPAHLKGHSFKEMFMWLTASLASMSRSKPGEEESVRLPSVNDWATI